MPAAVPPLHRRSALALGVLGTAVLTGCDGLGSSSSTGSSSPGVSTSPAADPDAELVDEVVARTSAAAAAAADVPALAALHAAHLEALDAGSSESPTPTPTQSPSQSAGPGRSLRATERDLQGFLTRAAVRAESGPLARLLASMSAAISQQLATLPAKALR